MWYFTRPDKPRENNAPSWFKDEISRSHLWFHLAQNKHFLENWRLTIRRYYYALGGKQPSGTTLLGMKWVGIQKKQIEDLIDKALDMNLLDKRSVSPHPTSSEILLSPNWKTREFLKPIPFFNAILKENGYIISFLFGAGGATLLFLANYFFGRILGFS